jgi:hypothetical protein
VADNPTRAIAAATRFGRRRFESYLIFGGALSAGDWDMSLFDVFGIASSAFDAAGVRMNVAASNLANVDTAGYKVALIVRATDEMLGTLLDIRH